MSKPSTDKRIQDLQAQLDAHADHVRDLSSDTSIPLEARSLMAALIDTVYDLGSGDGRLVIAAAKRFGARGINPPSSIVPHVNRPADAVGLFSRP